MTNSFAPQTQRIAILHAAWHADIVMKCVEGFRTELLARGYAADMIDTIEVPGAYEIPLQAKLLGQKWPLSGLSRPLVWWWMVVFTGHDFVAAAVCNGLMQVQLETEIPVLTAVLTPRIISTSTTNTAIILSVILW